MAWQVRKHVLPSKDGASRHRIWARQRTPNGRAILGGLLVAVAALGFAIAADRASAPPDTRFVVVAQPVAAGDIIRPEHLGLAPLELIGPVADAAVTQPDRVIGTIASHPLVTGEIVTESDILEKRDDTSRSVTLELPAADASGTELTPGDLVDIAASDESSGATQLIGDAVPVSDIDGAGDDALGSTPVVTVRLRVADPNSARNLIDAHRRGALTLIDVGRRGSTPGTIAEWHESPPAPDSDAPSTTVPERTS